MSADLYKGIAVIIDDKIIPKAGEEDDLIVKIVKKIKENGIPYCGYSTLKEAQSVINNLGAVSFLILDWDLQGDLDIDGAEDIIKPSHSHKVVKFVKDFKQVCFCPIFIFSNASIEDIKDTLKTQNLYSEDKENFIYVHTKSDLIKGKRLFNTIQQWINNNPTIYTLKNWENSFLSAKNKTFWHLFEKSPVWPKVLWQSFDEDSVDPHSNLNDVIYRLVRSRTSLTKLEATKIIKKGAIRAEEIRDVIQGTMYIDKTNIPTNEFRPGDIFKKPGGVYYINIRPECDTIIEREGCDGFLYLLKGTKVSAAQFRKNHYNSKYGIIKSQNNFLLYGLDGKDFIRFNLKEMSIEKYDVISTNRICRLLPPYISDIQQQFASYVGRFGLPRIPNKVLRTIK